MIVMIMIINNPQMSHTEPLPLNTLISELKNFYEEGPGRNVSPHVQAALERLSTLASRNEETQLAEE